MPIRTLVLKKLKDFDVILGMDWLSKYYVTVDCKSKVITFREPGQKEFTYRACQSSCFTATVSATRARKLVSRGCAAYLATVVEVDRVAPTLEELSVVREFPDVFPVELPGIPPDREIEFVIDLVPNTAPISKAPYRMAPAELKELRAQFTYIKHSSGANVTHWTCANCEFSLSGTVPDRRDRSPRSSVAAACEATGPWRMRPVPERDHAGIDRSHAGRDWFQNVGFSGQAKRPSQVGETGPSVRKLPRPG
uniref:Uncharacterized protein n=1 Tax=Ananas comosus var. bracteatus TaxID=296719 RepID=A0A6V7PQR9_ANACO|nr:unnamed protein product [Ananas comosus var. bracteatus]